MGSCVCVCVCTVAEGSISLFLATGQGNGNETVRKLTGEFSRTFLLKNVLEKGVLYVCMRLHLSQPLYIPLSVYDMLLDRLCYELLYFNSSSLFRQKKPFLRLFIIEYHPSCYF